jgi:hypothetical protein
VILRSRLARAARARRALAALFASLAALATHALLVPVTAERHVAHALLAAGNGPPPVGAALVALALVVVRLLALLVVPGALLAALTSLTAHVALGPPSAHPPEPDGTGVSSGAGISVGDPAGPAGTTIGVRGTNQ